MPATFRHALAAALLTASAILPASAQESEIERFAFAGGELTIEETPDYEKILSFDGKEIARDYYVGFDKVVEVSGTEVAIVSVGPGGNACAASTMLVWKDADDALQSIRAGEECNAPAVAVSDIAIFFVPYLMPGGRAPMHTWTPEEGLSTAATLAYSPEPGTTWQSLDFAKIGHPIDVFRNADVYAAAQALLGDHMEDALNALIVSNEPDTRGELLYARGCVPHACTVADGFIVVDKGAQALFFAQMDEDAGTRFWPDHAAWPAIISALIPSDF